jgi:Fe2+ or Zn2+ uptake regulation protein
MTPDSRENLYQDIIIQEPELAMVSLTQMQISLLEIPRYLDLVKIIHEKGPLTLAEVVEEYSALAKDDQAKSESTVYRYLTLLKDNNLVQEAGQRITEGKTHSRTLYSLTARFLIIDQPEIDWKSGYGQGLFKNLVKMLKILYPNKSIDEKALFQWQLEFQQTVDEDKHRLINSKDPVILDILSAWAPYDVHDLMEFLGWISILIKDSTVQQRFLRCFNQSSELDAVPLYTGNDVAPENNQVAYRDIIRHLPDLFCHLRSDDPRRSYLEKPAYLPLFFALRDRPMTIEELKEKYNEVAPVSRNLSTIYRYIKTLREVDLVIEMGQRVIHGQKTTQKLYGPVARVISFRGKYEPEWTSEPREWLLDAVIKMLEFLYPDLPPIDKEKFREFRATASQYEHEGNRRFSLPENRKIIELLHECDWRTFYQMYTTFWDYYYFINIADLPGRLQQCFSE